MTGPGRRRSRPRARHRRRGAILLEVVLSLTIFIFVGLAAISLASHALSSMQRAADARFAADVARTLLSRIETGMIAPEAAGGPVLRWASGSSADGDRAATVPGWSVVVDSQAGPLAELTLIAVQVQRESGPGSGGEPLTVYTLRQLVRLAGTSTATAAHGSTP
jgi:hypothetical protein